MFCLSVRGGSRVIHAPLGQGGKMATTTTTKHKLTGNQTAELALQLTVQTSLLEVGKQLNEYGKATATAAEAKEAKDNAKRALDKLIHTLHKAKVIIGDLPRTGADTGYANNNVSNTNVVIAIGLYNAMVDLKHGVRRNYISSLRICIKEDRKFNPNAPREKAKEKPKPKSKDQKHGAVKQSLADVIRANFKTLLAKNPPLAAELAAELAELAGV